MLSAAELGTPPTRKPELEDDFTCPVRGEIFHTPALLDCGNLHYIEHDAAKTILASDNKRCPCCRKPITKAEPNRVMKNLVDLYVKEHPELAASRYKPQAPIESKQQDAKEPGAPAALAVEQPVDDDADELQQAILQSLALNHAPVEAKAPPAPERKQPAIVMPVRGFADPAFLFSSSRSASYDSLVKILLIGNTSVNKSAFLLKFTNDTFSPDFIISSGIDFKIKTVEIDGKKIKLQMWDTAGQERFKTITDAYYRGTNAIFLMYNIADEQSFQAVSKWMKDIHPYINTVAVHLLGIQVAPEDERVIETAWGQALAEQFGISFFECSIMDGININEAFASLTRAALVKMQAAAAPAASSAEAKGQTCVIM